MFASKNRTRVWLFIALVVGLLSCGEALAKKPVPPDPEDPPVVAPKSYEILRLDDGIGGWIDCRAEDINAASDVVGYVEDPDFGLMAAYWDVTEADGEVTSELTLLPGGGVALGINDLGEMVGSARPSDGSPDDAVYWASADADRLVLPPLYGTGNATATGINNDGVVCGVSDRIPVVWRVGWVDGEPVVWPPEVLPGDPRGAALAVSENDEYGRAIIVGISQNTTGQTIAAWRWAVECWGEAGINVVPILCYPLQTGETWAFGVNSAGIACGEAGWPTQAMVWSPAEQTLALGKKMVDAGARDINDAEVVVGYSSTGMINDQAVVWHGLDGDMVLLNSYLPNKNSPFTLLVRANAINEPGRIVGYGIDTEARGAFIAIPE